MRTYKLTMRGPLNRGHLKILMRIRVLRPAIVVDPRQREAAEVGRLRGVGAEDLHAVPQAELPHEALRGRGRIHNDNTKVQESQ